MSVKTIDMPTVKMAFKNFFDSDAVIARVPEATRRAMSKAGSYIRSDAIRAINRFGGKKNKVNVVDEDGNPVLIRVRNKKGIWKTKQLTMRDSSKPGEAPMSQTGLLKKFLYFAHDEATNSVVIGPSIINTPSGAPATLEFGGTTTILKRYERVDDKTVRQLKNPKKENIHIAPRPYMGPALDKNMPLVAEVWRNQLSN